MTYALMFCRSLIGLVFLASSMSKLRGPDAFRTFVGSVRDMRVVPARLTVTVAVLVAAVEAATPLLLVPMPHALARTVGTVGFGLAATALAGFTGGIVALLRKGRAAGCRCFGGSAAPFGRRHVVRNAALFMAAAFGAYAAARGIPIGPPQVTLMAAPVAAVCAILVVRLDDLVSLSKPVSRAPTLARHD